MHTNNTSTGLKVNIMPRYTEYNLRIWRVVCSLKWIENHYKYKYRADISMRGINFSRTMKRVCWFNEFQITIHDCSNVSYRRKGNFVAIANEIVFEIAI